MQIGGQYRPGEVVVYLLTDDIDKALQKVEAVGGRILAPKTEVAEEGWFAWFADPGGNKVGLYMPADVQLPAGLRAGHARS